jgi:hypothetical protein
MCHFLVEDELHLFQCCHPIQTKAIGDLIARIQKEINTRKEVADTIISVITSFTRDTNWIPVLGEPSKGTSVQERIGWTQVLYGRLAREFVLELETPGLNHYLETKAEINGRKLIKAVWGTFLLLWRQ